ncbi:ribosomal protein L22 [Flagelloscypha sp. PMI_526]|nr:ribosomal protein L22 [Flagelloscypha sp. PMI_526]
MSKGVKLQFTIDCSKPAGESVFDTAAFEKYLHDRIKVDGKAGNLGDAIAIKRKDGVGNKVTVTSNIHLSKRYLKYLTKKFLKKNELTDFIRVTASGKDSYQLSLVKMEGLDDDEDDE